MKKIIVISLGGSLIVPKDGKANPVFLKKFKDTLKKNYKKYKFVIVTGGGSIARKHIEILKKDKQSKKSLSLAGIRATRMNALLLMQFFGKESNDSLPLNMKQVKDNLRQNKVVICGALRYSNNETSDGTAAKLANYLNSQFINMTNVQGLFSANPKTHKNSKFIPNISWKDFEIMAKKTKFKAGQHFVLDQSASAIIRINKIKTYILGPNLKNFNNLLKGIQFTGTTIEN